MSKYNVNNNFVYSILCIYYTSINLYGNITMLTDLDSSRLSGVVSGEIQMFKNNTKYSRYRSVQVYEIIITTIM